MHFNHLLINLFVYRLCISAVYYYYQGGTFRVPSHLSYWNYWAYLPETIHGSQLNPGWIWASHLSYWNYWAYLPETIHGSQLNLGWIWASHLSYWNYWAYLPETIHGSQLNLGWIWASHLSYWNYWAYLPETIHGSQLNLGWIWASYLSYWNYRAYLPETIHGSQLNPGWIWARCHWPPTVGHKKPHHPKVAKVGHFIRPMFLVTRACVLPAKLITNGSSPTSSKTTNTNLHDYWVNTDIAVLTVHWRCWPTVFWPPW